MSAIDNFALAKRETRLPGFSLVVDPSRVHDLLLSEQAIGPADHVELVYIRYKPGRRALALMEVVEPSGRRRPLVVNACDAAGWDKVVSISRDDDHQPSLRLADLKCTIDWFPCDRRLRQAAKLFDPAKTAKILNRVVGERSQEPWAFTTLAYKPHRRLVVKATSPSKTLTLKCYTAKDFPIVNRQICHVANAQIDGCSPCVLGTSKHYSMIASTWIEGQTLSGDLTDSSDWQHQFPKVGSLLAKWHTDAQRSLPMITHQHTAFARSSLLQLAADIVWLAPEIEEPLSQLLSKLGGTIDSLANGTNLIHGDFYAKQIVVRGAGLHLIDFDEVGRGHCYQDLGSFVGKLVWNIVRDSADIAPLNPAIEAFVGGYEEQMGPLDWPLFQTSVVAGILRSMPHAFRRGLPEWRRKMQQMFAFASEWCPKAPKLSLQSTVSGTGTRQLNSRLDSSETAPYLDIHWINQHWPREAALASQIADAQVVGAKLLRHKPGRRLLVEYSLKGSSAKIDQVIGKVRLNKPVDQKVTRLHNDLQALNSSGVRIPMVLGTIPQINLWMQEKITGRAVTPDSQLAIHNAVGQALAELHRSQCDISRSHSVQDELAVLRQQFEQWLYPLAEYSCPSEHLLQSCYTLVDDLIPVENTLIHRDFYFDQVLSTGDGIALLDFDLATMGPPELDVGNYIAHLDEFAVRNNMERDCMRAGDAFLAGYIDARPGLQLSNVKVWRYLSLARLVAISRRIVSRSHLTSQLFELCRMQTVGRVSRPVRVV